MNDLEQLWIRIQEGCRREHIRGHPALVCVPKSIQLMFWNIKKRLEEAE